MAVTCHDIIIIGAGFGGIGLGRHLSAADRDYLILEQAAEVGGVWRDNRYPGAACDVPSHLYSFSFAADYPWQRRFGTQAEIFAYLKHCSDRFSVTPHVRFRQRVLRAAYEPLRRRWQLTTATGEVFECRILVTATGQLSRPALPGLPGLETFAGQAFHSANWPVPDQLDGRRVIVIGTGASAIQFVPEIAPRVRELTVMQRSAPFVISKPDWRYGPIRQWLFRHFPWLVTLHRAWIYTLFEHRVPGFRGAAPWIMKLLEWNFRRQLRRQVPDPSLRQKLLPDYPMGCKRILLSDDWYPTLVRDNVRVETTAIRAVEAEGLRLEDNRLLPADTLIFGTGFRATDFLSPIQVLGRDGLCLDDFWRQGARAHLGITVSGFPNLFMLYGPNTNLGHNSIIYMLESQFNYILDAIRLVLDEGVPVLEVKPVAEQRYNESLQASLAGTVWQQGCHSWYLNEQGINTNNWPDFTFVYRHRTRHLRLDDYDCHPT